MIWADYAGESETPHCTRIQFRNSELPSQEIKMFAAKEKMTKIIQDQPEDSTYDEILRELAFVRMIDRGLKDSRDNKVLSNEEMEHRIVSWRK